MPQYSIITPVPGTRLWNRLHGDTIPPEENWKRHTYFSCADPAAIEGLGMSPGELEQAWESAYRTAMTPDAVSKRLSKTKFRTAFMMAGTYFANYMFTTFSETGYWGTIRGELEQNDLSMPTVRQAATI